MSEWVPVDRWHECARMERPGVLFEVVNAEGQRILTPCVKTLPVPFGWTSPPIQFRVVAAARPRHSSPIPPPGGKPAGQK
jgi:hypothetical protein